MSDKVKRAELLARFVHLGQKRQDGEDYIKHCERIVHKLASDFFDNNLSTTNEALPFTTDQEDMICAAWLHDCIEDANPDLCMNDFILAAFGYDVWDIVIRLTHDEYLQTYDQYMEEVFKHPIAWQIKWLDMIDNTSYNVPKRQWEKYRSACIMLSLHNVTVPDILKNRLKLEE